MAGPGLVRVPLASSLTPAQALRALRGDRRPFALVRAWAGGGAVVGSEPVEVPSSLPAAPGPGVFGGWFGWLGYPLGARFENVRPAPPRPLPFPSSSVAFYDHVLRLDSEGQWWFEALGPRPERLAEL